MLITVFVSPENDVPSAWQQPAGITHGLWAHTCSYRHLTPQLMNHYNNNYYDEHNQSGTRDSALQKELCALSHVAKEPQVGGSPQPGMISGHDINIFLSVYINAKYSYNFISACVGKTYFGFFPEKMAPKVDIFAFLVYFDTFSLVHITICLNYYF